MLLLLLLLSENTKVVNISSSAKIHVSSLLSLLLLMLMVMTMVMRPMRSMRMALRTSRIVVASLGAFLQPQDERPIGSKSVGRRALKQDVQNRISLTLFLCVIILHRRGLLRCHVILNLPHFQPIRSSDFAAQSISQSENVAEAEQDWINQY